MHFVHLLLQPSPGTIAYVISRLHGCDATHLKKGKASSVAGYEIYLFTSHGATSRGVISGWFLCRCNRIAFLDEALSAWKQHIQSVAQAVGIDIGGVGGFLRDDCSREATSIAR